MPTVFPPSIRKSLRTPKAPTRLGDDDSHPPPTRLEPVSSPPPPTPTRLEPASSPVHVLMVDDNPPDDVGTLSSASAEQSSESEPSTPSPRHAWSGYEAKDLYNKWAIARATITELRAKVEASSGVVREKGRVILQYERKMVSEESTAKKWAESCMEVTRLKVEKSALLDKLKRSGEVKKEMKDSLSAEYKLLLQTSELKCKGAINESQLELAKQKLLFTSMEDRLCSAKLEICALRDKSKKYDDIAAKGVNSLIAMNAFNEKAEVR